MSTQCPHCNGVVGFAQELVGVRVSCPHCDNTFIMREDCTPPPVIQNAATEGPSPQQPNVAALLDNLLQAQVANNRMLECLTERACIMAYRLFNIQGLLIVIVILLIILLTTGLTVEVKRSPW